VDVKLQELQQRLSGLCWALNRFGGVAVFNYQFSPKEYLTEGLEQWFGKALAELATEDGRVVRPSSCLAKVRTRAGMHACMQGDMQADIHVAAHTHLRSACS